MPKSTRDSWNRFSLESNRSYWCLDFTFSAFRIVRQYKFLLFKPPYLWCLVFASPGYEYSCVCMCVFVCVCVCVCVHAQSLLTLWLFAIPWTVTHQAFLSMGFSWQELLEWVAISYSRGASWSSDQTRSSALQVDSLPTEPPGNTVLLWIMDVRGWNWRQEKQFWEKLIPKLIGLI